MTSRPRNATASTKVRPRIYPLHCHSLSPTANQWCPLAATAVHNLVQISDFEGQDIYHHSNHPIKWIRLTGVIVAVDNMKGRMIYTLDDSSGATIECTCLDAPAPPLPLDPDPNYASASSRPIASEPRISPDGPDLTHIDVGSVVKVKGVIKIFRETKTVHIKRMVTIGDTSEEVKAWTGREKFWRDVLGSVWVVSAEEERKCLEAVETERKVLKEEERRRARGGRLENKQEREKAEVRQDDRKKARQERWSQGKNKTSLLSMAARRRAAGKFDALGI